MGQTMATYCSCKNVDTITESGIVKEGHKENEILKVKQIHATTMQSSLTSQPKYLQSSVEFMATLDPQIKPIMMNAYASKVTAMLRIFSKRKKSDISNGDKVQYLNKGNHIKTANFVNPSCTYKGNKVNQMKEGFGIQLWKDGAKYVGYFHLNKANGHGLFIHSEGDQYLGNFFNDRLSGYGVYKHNNGSVYHGQWKNDSQHGIGIETWKDGSEYQGEYYNGKKHGIGSYYWSDGTKYQGEWAENNLNGFGVYYFNDDRIYCGQWINNMMNGLGQFIWRDGKKYTGFYMNDKKEGFGIYSWTSPKKIFIGFWKEGQQNGIGKYMDLRKIKYGYWANGKKIKWFVSQEEAFSFMDTDQEIYQKYFNLSLEKIDLFLESCEKY